jgi:hypothetical protein
MASLGIRNPCYRFESDAMDDIDLMLRWGWSSGRIRTNLFALSRQLVALLASLVKFGSSSAARAGSLQIPPGRRLCGLLSVWYWQHGHDLDGVARENRKVRMPLEEFGRGLV